MLLSMNPEDDDLDRDKQGRSRSKLRIANTPLKRTSPVKTLRKKFSVTS